MPGTDSEHWRRPERWRKSIRPGDTVVATVCGREWIGEVLETGVEFRANYIKIHADSGREVIVKPEHIDHHIRRAPRYGNDRDDS